MGKVDLGMKLTCESCGARFYDLNKQPGVCPKCGTKNARPQVFRTRRPAEERAEKQKALAAAAAAEKELSADDADVDVDDDDEAEGVIEDTSDLGGEADEDVEVVVEKDET